MIYMDNSSSTALCEKAVARMEEAMGCFGNPSSLHSAGFGARTMLEDARQFILKAVCKNDFDSFDLVFTGSGTESNNFALYGTANAKRRMISKRIITTDSEHASVLRAADSLQNFGFEHVKIPTTAGVLDLERLEEELKKGAFLVSLMLVNNETGARYAIEEAFRKTKEICPEAITHCDATQGFMRIETNPKKLGADLMTVSSHKVHGPKGVGALLVSKEIIKKKSLVPLIYGGGQENGFRSGTENFIGIYGFFGAVEQFCADFISASEKISAVRDYAAEKTAAAGASLNIPKGKRAPHILSVTLPGIKSETMVHFLSSKGICVSSGSACSSHAKNPSPSLIGFGLTPQEADCTVRISLCEQNGTEEVDALASAMKDGIKNLVRTYRVTR